MTEGQVYVIGTDTSGCDDQNAYCDTNVTADDTCVNLAGLVTEGYIGSVPIGPDGDDTWVAGQTGYTLSKASTGILIIEDCESENATEISILRQKKSQKKGGDTS
ncbi:MAG: hypothetical protein U9M92_02200 [Patescibacteria group bacterium]|nr:hypothetical protein [Patescibacteria group bacterium]